MKLLWPRDPSLQWNTAAAAAAAKSLQSCLTLQPHRQQPNRLPRPWDSPGKNTGVGQWNTRGSLICGEGISIHSRLGLCVAPLPVAPWHAHRKPQGPKEHCKILVKLASQYLISVYISVSHSSFTDHLPGSSPSRIQDPQDGQHRQERK